MQNVIERFMFTNFAVANCVRTFVDATRLAFLLKPMAYLLTHRIWASASPPEEVIPV
jgi:hypothetical protein